jgi:hypothetical protein
MSGSLSLTRLRNPTYKTYVWTECSTVVNQGQECVSTPLDTTIDGGRGPQEFRYFGKKRAPKSQRECAMIPGHNEPVRIYKSENKTP